MASRQTRQLLDLLDGFEMTKSQHDWLERRFENMTVKESLLFRGAMQIEQPRMTCDVMLIASQLDHYDLFYGAGDDVQLGKFIMEQIQRPSDQAREFLDPGKVGAAYRQKGGNTFCDGHFIKVTSLIDPFLDSDPSMNPDKGDFAIRVKLASRTNMDGVWVGFPDTDEYTDAAHPDELLLALDELEAESLTGVHCRGCGLLPPAAGGHPSPVWLGIGTCSPCHRLWLHLERTGPGRTQMGG